MISLYALRSRSLALVSSDISHTKPKLPQKTSTMMNDNDQPQDLEDVSMQEVDGDAKDTSMEVVDENSQQQDVDQDDTTNHQPQDENQQQDDKDTSSSDDKEGSGGSGGYSADYECESSDTSSDKGNDSNEKEPASSSPEQKDCDDSNTSDQKPAAKPLQQRDDDPSNSVESSKPHSSHHFHQASQLGHLQQPVQWNGVRIQHPMDPRIDLSSVGYLHPSNAASPSVSQTFLKVPPSAFPPLAPNPSSSANNIATAASSRTNETGEPPPMFPSFEQYMKLMEVTTNTIQLSRVVRPWYISL